MMQCKNIFSKYKSPDQTHHTHTPNVQWSPMSMSICNLLTGILLHDSTHQHIVCLPVYCEPSHGRTCDTERPRRGKHLRAHTVQGDARYQFSKFKQNNNKWIIGCRHSVCVFISCIHHLIESHTHSLTIDAIRTATHFAFYQNWVVVLC